MPLLHAEVSTDIQYDRVTNKFSSLVAPGGWVDWVNLLCCVEQQQHTAASRICNARVSDAVSKPGASSLACFNGCRCRTLRNYRVCQQWCCALGRRPTYVPFAPPDAVNCTRSTCFTTFIASTRDFAALVVFAGPKRLATVAIWRLYKTHVQLAYPPFLLPGFLHSFAPPKRPPPKKGEQGDLSPLRGALRCMRRARSSSRPL
jgi:hypothetical protein